MKASTLSFVLCLERNDAQDFEELSVALDRELGSQMVLGRGAAPHLTILQIEAEVDEADRLWAAAVERSLPMSVEMDAAGLCILPTPDSLESWIEVPILKSQALSELQSGLLLSEVIGHRPIFNGVGDEFRPHVTVGLVDGLARSIPELTAPGNILRRRIAGRLCLGISGEHYSLVQILRDSSHPDD